MVLSLSHHLRPRGAISLRRPEPVRTFPSGVQSTCGRAYVFKDASRCIWSRTAGWDG